MIEKFLKKNNDGNSFLVGDSVSIVKLITMKFLNSQYHTNFHVWSLLRNAIEHFFFSINAHLSFVVFQYWLQISTDYWEPLLEKHLCWSLSNKSLKACNIVKRDSNTGVFQ